MDILTSFTHDEIECEALNCPAWVVREKSTSLVNIVAKLSPSLPFICANCTLKGKADPCVHCMYVKEHFHFIVDPLDYPEEKSVCEAILSSCITLQLLIDELDTRNLLMIREKLYDEKPTTPISNIREDEMEFLETVETRLLTDVEAELGNRAISRFAFRTFRRNRKAFAAMVNNLSLWAVEYNKKNREIVKECQKVSEGEKYDADNDADSDSETVPPTWKEGGVANEDGEDTDTEEQNVLAPQDMIV